ncbi:MAG: DUF2283 domain-containing protein [bacterium]|nr:DUF2283 domain-containing protein [bacterium]
MKLTYDEEADAMYIYLNQRDVAKTVRVSNRVVVDLDEEGNLRGIEVLFVSKALAGTDFSHVSLQLPKVGEIDLRLPVPL